MTNIAIPVPPSLQFYRSHLREFISTMLMKLDINSHKNTPCRQDIQSIVSLLRSEVDEFEEQVAIDVADPNCLVELCDVANYAFLAFIALRNEGVATRRENLIKENLTVDVENGIVYCAKNKAGSKYRVGDEIKGAHRNGYIDIKLRRLSCSMTIPRSHLVWWSANGIWPVGVIDHDNRIRNDDRISNLRDRTFSENNLNNGKISKWPRHVVQYVPSGRSHLPHYGKFVYQRYHEGVNIRVAYFSTPEEASVLGEREWMNRVKTSSFTTCPHGYASEQYCPSCKTSTT